MEAYRNLCDHRHYGHHKVASAVLAASAVLDPALEDSAMGARAVVARMAVAAVLELVMVLELVALDADAHDHVRLDTRRQSLLVQLD